MTNNSLERFLRRGPWRSVLAIEAPHAKAREFELAALRARRESAVRGVAEGFCCARICTLPKPLA